MSIWYASVGRVCPNCGKSFTWKAKTQRTFHYNTRAGSDPKREPCCDWQCAGQYNGRRLAARTPAELARARAVNAISSRFSWEARWAFIDDLIRLVQQEAK